MQRKRQKVMLPQNSLLWHQLQVGVGSTSFNKTLGLYPALEWQNSRLNRLLWIDTWCYWNDVFPTFSSWMEKPKNVKGGMSGEFGGCRRTRTTFSSRKLVVILEVWGCALSCWNAQHHMHRAPTSIWCQRRLLWENMCFCSFLCILLSYFQVFMYLLYSFFLFSKKVGMHGSSKKVVNFETM